jgi:hypothetical protein
MVLTSAVMDAAFENAVLDERDQGEGCEQDDGESRGIAGIPEREANRVNVKQEQCRGVVGAATGEHDDMVDSAESADDRVD